jgi:putative ubiquitin-RnfH superfamily antitoxin RatB of RatAB toxin-antitoxin module
MTRPAGGGSPIGLATGPRTDDGRPADLAIEVVWAERDRQTLLALAVPPGTTAARAVELSGIRERHPGIPVDAPLGVHGRTVPGSHVLSAGDRVELYRPLPADPKETRRRLAREGRTMGAAGRGPGAGSGPGGRR